MRGNPSSNLHGGCRAGWRGWQKSFQTEPTTHALPPWVCAQMSCNLEDPWAPWGQDIEEEVEGGEGWWEQFLENSEVQQKYNTSCVCNAVNVSNSYIFESKGKQVKLTQCSQHILLTHNRYKNINQKCIIFFLSFLHLLYSIFQTWWAFSTYSTSLCRPATFQVLSCHLWPVATILSGTNVAERVL